MIYCDIKKRENGSAIYSFGISTDNISGEARFFSKLKAAEILKQPKGEEVPVSFLAKVYAKYYKQFKKSDFPDKLSYER